MTNTRDSSLMSNANSTKTLNLAVTFFPAAVRTGSSSLQSPKMSFSISLLVLLFLPWFKSLVRSFPIDRSFEGRPRLTTSLYDSNSKDSTKAAPTITGEELERLLTEWEKPLVVDAYATWCGPCLLMAPEFEEAAKALGDKVRFVKLDTDKEETMAARLNIAGLPTILFLDKYDGDDGAPAAVLKGRIEGALQKQNIIDLCEHHFFDGPEPKIF